VFFFASCAFAPLQLQLLGNSVAVRSLVGLSLSYAVFFGAAAGKFGCAQHHMHATAHVVVLTRSAAKFGRFQSLLLNLALYVIVIALITFHLIVISLTL
jgi:hypothetical protein